MDSGFAVNENVVLNDVVPAATYERRSRDPNENVPENGCPAQHIVQVNAHTAFVLKARYVAEQVEADDRPAPCPVATAVDCACIVGFQANPLNAVEFNQVLVPAEGNCLVRCVVNEVVPCFVPDAVERYRWEIHPMPAGVMVDVVVFGKVV
jgi:hypothetical protein